MTSEFSFERPDNLRATMSITMKVSEWRALRLQMNAQMKNEWPACDLASAIDEILGNVDKVFFCAIPEKGASD